MKITQMTDWYGVSRREVLSLGGKGLFRYYSTLEKALRVAYPDFPWDSAAFKNINKTPSGHWKKKDNLLEALKAAEQKMGLTKVPTLLVEQCCVREILRVRERGRRWVSVERQREIMSVSPLARGLVLGEADGVEGDRISLQCEQDTVGGFIRGDVSDLSMGKGTPVQREICPTEAIGEDDRGTLPCNVSLPPLVLTSLISRCFKQGDEIICNAREAARLVNSATGDYFELDIFVPSLSLAFEYQVYHSSSTLYLSLPFSQKHSCLSSGRTSFYGYVFGVSSPTDNKNSRRDEEGSGCLSWYHTYSHTLLVGRISRKVAHSFNPPPSNPVLFSLPKLV